MLLTDEQIVQFQTLYKTRFGVEIDHAQALEKGVQLMRLVELVYKPMTEDEYQKVQERRRETDDLKT